jgi:hypothetical protein
VIPDPPQTTMMHLLLDTTADEFVAASRRLATEQHVWTWPGASATVDPGVQRLELSVGDGALALSPERIRDIMATLAGSPRLG